jgi:hypothetical protein
VVFQGLVYLKVKGDAWWENGLRRIVEIIKSTMDNYTP